MDVEIQKALFSAVINSGLDYDLLLFLWMYQVPSLLACSFALF